MTLAPQRNDSAPDLHIRTLRVMVTIPRRSEWWRSATLTAGPCASLPLNRTVAVTLSDVGQALRSSTGTDVVDTGGVGGATGTTGLAVVCGAGVGTAAVASVRFDGAGSVRRVSLA